MSNAEFQDWVASQPEIYWAKMDNGNLYVSFKDSNEGLASRLVEKAGDWAKLFEMTYTRTAGQLDPEFDHGVWRNSYDGDSIPSAEMREWVDLSVDRLLKHCLPTTRVLEIGCGTGMLMYPLLPHIMEFVGIDSSPKAIENLKMQMSRREESKKVQFFVKDASDLDSLPPSSFDLVIINSVAQYFPNADYFLQVLASLQKFLAKNSIIFIGDVRSLPLQRSLYLDMFLKRKGPAASVGELKKFFEAFGAREKETLFSPVFFHALPKVFDWIGDVRTEAKTGKFANEMNKFRFDVTLFSNSDRQSSATFRGEEIYFTSKTEFETFVHEKRSSSFLIRRFPNDQLSALRSIELGLSQAPDDMKLEQLISEIGNVSGTGYPIAHVANLLRTVSKDCVFECGLSENPAEVTIICSEGSSKVFQDPKNILPGHLSNHVGLPDQISAEMLNLKSRVAKQFGERLMPQGFYRISSLIAQLLS